MNLGFIMNRNKIILISIMVFVLIIVMALLNISFISIDGPVDSTIILLDEKDNVIKKEINTGKMFHIGHTGTYRIRVSRLNTEKQRIIKTGPLLTSVKTDLPKELEYSITPIAPVNTSSFMVLKDKIVYLDENSQEYMQLSADNPKPQSILQGYQMNLTRWNDKGEGLTYDSTTNSLYIIDNSLSLKKLPMPSGVTLSSDTYYALTPSGSIYISENNAVFTTNNQGKDYTKLLTTDQKQAAVFPSNNGSFVVADYPIDQSDKLEDPKATITSYSKDGKILASIGDVIRFNLSVSPSGDYVAIYKSTDYSRDPESSPKTESSYVLSSKTLKPIASISTDNNPHFTWSDNSTLFYTSDREVWKLSLDGDQLSELVTRIPYGRLIQSISWQNSNLYMNSYFNRDLASLSVIKPGKVDYDMRSIELNLPAIYDDCIVTYTNFNKPIISSYPATDNQTPCVNAAKGYMDLLKIPLDSIEIK